MTSRNILKSTAIAFTISIGLASAALAECNFEGETITIVVPFGEGGGTSQTFGFFPALSSKIPAWKPIDSDVERAGWWVHQGG